MIDIKSEIWKIMDEAGLSASNILSTQEPMQKIVNKIRMQIATKVIELVKEGEGKL